ncbi:hypothetical protein FA95DRAFT_1071742 [Auriscalpium vulgare]|uniref:Uncharacterized protein n=1 Tax=Auriscalpium vulgare TaxID=40419 RepID=A0ACB8RVV3_9AGAM|nr:hypothetical protein FA95DRAFT_1071742 [Auriscalpium vulgare]
MRPCGRTKARSGFLDSHPRSNNARLTLSSRHYPMAANKASSSLYARRKAFAIKHEEAEPLTRKDIQYDFLDHIFGSQECVFTDPFSPPDRVTFRDLYVHALTHSARCSRALKDKMQDVPDFGTDFAKISLLANVGRVNTTMTFLPEMRTSLRTYHPVPALQKADSNLQDAPRIKTILKACTLQDEANSLPVSPAELLERAAKGTVPSTSIVNLLFVLSNHFANVAQDHFGRLDIDFLDLFLPVHITSVSRARAFLWLVYHYHESPSSPNPFADNNAQQHRGLVPRLIDLSEEDFKLENLDPEDEKAYAAKMSQYRLDFLARHAKEYLAKGEGGEGTQPPPAKVKKGRGSKGKGAADKKKRQRPEPEPSTPPEDAEAVVEAPPLQRRRLSYDQRTPEDTAPRAAAAPPLERILSPAPAPAPRHYHPVDPRLRYGPQRSPLQQAWHIVATLDPLVDDEEGADSASHFSYMLRHQVLINLHAMYNPDRPLAHVGAD